MAKMFGELFLRLVEAAIEPIKEWTQQRLLPFMGLCEARCVSARIAIAARMYGTKRLDQFGANGDFDPFQRVVQGEA